MIKDHLLITALLLCALCACCAPRVENTPPYWTHDEYVEDYFRTHSLLRFYPANRSELVAEYISAFREGRFGDTRAIGQIMKYSEVR